ncbi:MAG: helix-turn-helix transcriptional regulator [Bacteroidota bacterium]|jgi:excisionase family DNA binding protein|nr:helix-turn-helix domain-containing protein [Bacteroidota bacterium]
MEKTILNFNDLAIYTGLSKSYLYKLSSVGKIPAYKPFGKCLFFEKEQIDLWLKQNPVFNADELETKASTIVTLKQQTKGGVNQ